MTDPVRISKFLSLVLRHKPETIGLALDEQGFADIDDLILKAGPAGVTLDRALIQDIVQNSDKQRFKLSDDGRRIRANQGHSIEVDLGLIPVTPPFRLYHGTALKLLPTIRLEGLKKMSRRHVHLSPDEETAVKVGQRHGKPVVLIVKAEEMFEAGLVFFRSENGVWLTDHVSPRFIEVAPNAD